MKQFVQTQGLAANGGHFLRVLLSRLSGFYIFWREYL